MTITVQNGVAQIVLSNAPVVSAEPRGLYITIEKDANDDLVTVSFTNKLVAPVVIGLISRTFEVELTEQNRADILAALA